MADSVPVTRMEAPQPHYNQPSVERSTATDASDRPLAVRLLLAHFFNRTDRIALALEGGTPVPVNLAPNSLATVVWSHACGNRPGTPRPILAYRTEHSTGRVSAPHRIGSYTPDADGMTRWACVDLDGGAHHAASLADPVGAALAVCQVATMLGIPVHLERSASGKGWHVWVLFSEPVSALLARHLALALVPGSVRLVGGAVAVPGAAPVEVFPKTTHIADVARESWTGSMVYLPMWAEAKRGCCAWYRGTTLDSLEQYEPVEFSVVEPMAAEAALAFYRETCGPIHDPGASGPVKPRLIRPSTASAPLIEWRRAVLAVVDLDWLFPGLLTGRTQRRGWLECRDPRSPSGDASRSAGVADGTGSAARGTWHSFRDGQTYGAFDWLVYSARARDFREACRAVAVQTGILMPPPAWLVEAMEQAEEGAAADEAERALHDEHGTADWPEDDQDTAVDGSVSSPEDTDSTDADDSPADSPLPDFGDGTDESGPVEPVDQPEPASSLASVAPAASNVVVLAPAPRPGNWENGLTFKTVGKQSLVVPNHHNVLLILSNHPAWKGVLGFDDFKQRPVMLKRSPAHDDAHAPVGHQVPWSDADDVLCAAWLQRSRWEINVSVSTVVSVVPEVAKIKHGHPVRAWLSRLAWDGKPRIDTWLTQYLGTMDSAYARAVGARWLISAVARVHQPGCKADCVLVLEGRQGSRKSTALAEITGRQWFTDDIADLGTKDAAMQLLGVWVIEIAELDSLKRTELSKSKAFIARGTDRFRSPYGRKVADFPRQCVFAASTNEMAYLADPTGARRFWPVRCGTIDIEAIKDDREQIWAEATTRYLAGSPWYLNTSDLEAAAGAEQEARFQVDEWEPRIADYLAKRSIVAVSKIMQDELCIMPEDWSQLAQNRVAHCLNRLGWVRRRVRVTDANRDRLSLMPGFESGRVSIYAREADPIFGPMAGP